MEIKRIINNHNNLKMKIKLIVKHAPNIFPLFLIKKLVVIVIIIKIKFLLNWQIIKTISQN